MSARLAPSVLVPALVTLLAACGGDAGKQAGPKDAKVDAKAEAKADAKADDKADAKAVPEDRAEKTGPEGQPEYAWDLPRGLKAPAVPADNPMTADKVALGHALFMDKRLSVDGTRSCYSCHQNQLGNADGREKALGPGDKPLARNTPTIWNVAYHTALYWDGRSPTLEKQAIGAWKGGNMGVGEEGLAAKAAEIGALYRQQFAAVFGLKDGEAVTPDHVAKALSAYQRTLLCGGTPWDTSAMNEAQQRGWELFRGKAACATCHVGDNFTDDLFHNVGVGVPAKGEGPDKGRMDATKDPADLHKFRTPTLRNVTRTAPYFHDGSVADLRAAVVYMAKGGDRKAPGLDTNLADRGLTDAELDDLVAFMSALDCPGALEVIGDQSVPGITDRAPGAPAKADKGN